MRILISSNAPWVSTGYGVQTAITALCLKQMGHEVAVLAFWGLQGTKINWGEIPVYPNDPRDYGVERAKAFYDDWQADIFMTHVDIWVLGNLDTNLNWVPRFPIDHEPVPPLVIDILKHHPALVKPLIESRYGQRLLAKEKVEAAYIPPAVDCGMYIADKGKRKRGRGRYNWEDKFVVGTVATNHAERKNWTAAMKAMKLFESKHPDEIIYYMHTNPLDPRGINLLTLREELDIKRFSVFPSQVQMAIGIDTNTMVNIYNVMDVFLMPSKGEGVGVPLIEAQACSVPIITTKCTGQEEVMGGGWFIEKLMPQWTAQSAWQYECYPEEIVERLEQAYQAKKDGSIVKIQAKARKKALEYDMKYLFNKVWPPVLDEIQAKIKQPRNCEGIQKWRLLFIPSTCIPRKVLDIGCGITQPYKEHLEHLGEYVGVDIRNGHNIIQADAHKLPFGDKEFGFVWLSEVLEHCDKPDEVIAEAKRVGIHGICLFSTPENPYYKGDPDHRPVTTVDYVTVSSGDGLISW